MRTTNIFNELPKPRSKNKFNSLNSINIYKSIGIGSPLCINKPIVSTKNKDIKRFLQE